MRWAWERSRFSTPSSPTRSSLPFILRAPRAAKATQVFLRAWEIARVPIQNGRNSAAYQPRLTLVCAKATARATPRVSMATPMSRRLRTSLGPMLASCAFPTFIESYRIFLFGFTFNSRHSHIRLECADADQHISHTSFTQYALDRWLEGEERARQQSDALRGRSMFDVMGGVETGGDSSSRPTK